MAQILSTIRAEIEKAEKAGTTRYAIAKATGVEQSTLARIMGNPDYSPTIRTVELLADYFGLELRKRAKRAKARKGGGA